jgi:hypothetical protein
MRWEIWFFDGERGGLMVKFRLGCYGKLDDESALCFFGHTSLNF